jgi:hypothetical protein
VETYIAASWVIILYINDYNLPQRSYLLIFITILQVNLLVARNFLIHIYDLRNLMQCIRCKVVAT